MTECWDVAYRQYDKLAQKAARSLCPVEDRLDRIGQTQSDYVSDLRERAAQAAFRFQQEQGFCTPAEARYVAKSVYMRRTTWRRVYQRREALGVEFLSWDTDPIPRDTPAVVYEVQGQLEARSVLHWLRERLSKKDWDAMLELAELEGARGQHGSYSEMVERHPEAGLSRKQWEWKFRKLREQAQRLLDKANEGA